MVYCGRGGWFVVWQGQKILSGDLFIILMNVTAMTRLLLISTNFGKHMLFELNVENIIAEDIPIQSEEFNSLQNSFDEESLKIKKLMNRCFEIYGNDDQENLERRIKSDGEPGHFNSICCEMLIAYFFHVCGFTFITHPNMLEGETCPDFLFTSPDGKQFYLEVVMVTENSREHEIEFVKNHIQQYTTENHVLHIESLEGRALDKEEEKAFIRFIRKWWHDYGRNKASDGVCWKSLDGEFKLELLVLPKDDFRTTGHIYKSGFEAALMRGLRRKKDKYGRMNLPYIIAIGFQPSTFTPSLYFDPAFGEIYSAIFSMKKVPTEDLNRWKIARGFWDPIRSPKQNDNVSAILYFQDLSLESSLDHATLDLFINAHAVYPIPDVLKTIFPYVSVENETTTNLSKEYLYRAKFNFIDVE